MQENNKESWEVELENTYFDYHNAGNSCEIEECKCKEENLPFLVNFIKQILSKREAGIREEIEKYRITLEHFSVVSDGEMPRIWKAKADTCTEILSFVQPKD